MLPSQIKSFSRTLAAINETLVTELQAIQQSLRDQISAIRDANEANEKNRGEIPQAIAALQPTEAAKRENRSYRQKSHAVQVILMFATCGAFLAAAIYAGFAYRTLKEAHKQTTAAQDTARAAQDQAKLMRQQLEGSEAAFFEFRPNLNDGSDSFSPSAYNWGHSNANNLHMDISFEERSIPDERVVWRSKIFVNDVPVAPAQKGATYTNMRIVKIDWDSVHALRTYVRANMNYRYDNGFGTIVKGSECWIWVGRNGRSPPPSCYELAFTIEAERRNQQNTQKK